MIIKSLMVSALVLCSTQVFANFQVEALNCSLVSGQRPQPDITVTKITVFIEMMGGSEKDATLLMEMSAKNHISRIVVPATADVDMGHAMKVEAKGGNDKSALLTVDMRLGSNDVAKATWGTATADTWNYTCKIFNK
jgi:hypothetical protein